MHTSKNTQPKEDHIQDPTPDSPPYSDELGGWKGLSNPAAVFSAWSRVRERTGGVKIKVPMDIEANDNTARQTLSKLCTALLVLGVFALAAVLEVNASAVATKAVLHTHDQALIIAMNAHPEALGHVINAMDVGGSE